VVSRPARPMKSVGRSCLSWKAEGPRGHSQVSRRAAFGIFGGQNWVIPVPNYIIFRN
jgi:hypothetical protein